MGGNVVEPFTRVLSGGGRKNLQRILRKKQNQKPSKEKEFK